MRAEQRAISGVPRRHAKARDGEGPQGFDQANPLTVGKD
jgi:hypothetical protein